jgi:hypothetical protein
MYVVCAIATAATREYTSVNDFLLAATGGNIGASEIVSTNTDINGDSRADWSGIIISPPNEATRERRATVYVLVQSPSGGYRIDGESARFEYSPNARGWVEIVQVTGKGAFYIQFNSRGGTCGVSALRYGFTKGPRVWRLTRLDFLGPETCEYSTLREFTIDYVTGRSVAEINARGKVRKIRARKSYPIWLLRDFDVEKSYGADEFFGKY